MKRDSAFFDRLSSYRFDLPEELIAQHPATPRDSSKLLHVDRKTKVFRIYQFSELRALLSPQDFLVFNNTKVVPARLPITLAGGGQGEILVFEIEGNNWKALLRPSSRMKIGKRVACVAGVEIEPVESLGSGLWKLKAHGLKEPAYQFFDRYGAMPLPPYIRKGRADEKDKENYQTVLAKKVGSCAAPTASLHFTKKLLLDLKKTGVSMAEITLHTGLGTFLPVRVEDLTQHTMHQESFHIESHVAKSILEAPVLGKRRVIVGTTTLRALESSYKEGRLQIGDQTTRLFVRAPYTFHVADSLITNFHLPESTLLMLTCAFGGYDLIMEAYRFAVAHRLRFFSYGDAMWIT